jgi:hypothetical protein
MDAESLIRQATLAPSGHNTQPWLFSVSGNAITIRPDSRRRLPVVDADDHALYISLGCALENLVIAALEEGLSASVDYHADRLEVTFTTGAPEQASALFSSIPRRQSNRSMYDGRPVPDEDLAKLLAANVFDGVEVRAYRINDPAIEPVIDLVKDANRLQFRDPAFVEELIAWIRFSEREAARSNDGLPAKALGFPAVPRWLGELIMKRLVKPDREAKRCEKAIRSSSLLLIFVARKNDQRHWVDVGRTFERVALTATSLGIAHAHLNMPCEVTTVRPKLARQLGLDDDAQPLLLIRLGYAKALPRTPRRSVDEVMSAPAPGAA